MRKVAGKLALLGLAIGVALGAAEAGLRLVGYEYRPMQIAVGDVADARVYHLFSDENFIYDPELIWRPKPGFGVFNSLGFRGPEVGERNGRVRIAAVGDSNTLGWSGADGANWPADLERLLRRAGVDGEVINAGVWGYSSHQGVPRTREVLALQPDVVLISFGSNDAHPVRRSDAEFSGGSLGGRRLARLVRGLRTVQLINAALDRLDPAGAEPKPRVSREDYRANLEAMIADVRRAGAAPVLMTRPFYGTVYDTARWKHFAPEYNAATAAVAETERVPLIDLYTWFKELDDLFADESHFTAQGHELAASIILEHLRPVLAAP